MRNTVKIVALFAGLAAVLFGATPAQAATTRPAIPTCLIANVGQGGFFGKATTCAELLGGRDSHAASGRFTPGDHAEHTLTVTVQELIRVRGQDVWVPVASATKHGHGALIALTRPVHTRRTARLRACSGTDGQPHSVCTA